MVNLRDIAGNTEEEAALISGFLIPYPEVGSVCCSGNSVSGVGNSMGCVGNGMGCVVVMVLGCVGNNVCLVLCR